MSHPGPPPPPPGPGRMRCLDPRPHGPHSVPPRGTRTPFQCAGRPTDAEIDRTELAAFGLEPIAP